MILASLEPDNVTTIGGLIALVAAIILKDAIIGKKRNIIDNSKLSELQQQTELLQRIAKGNRRNNKKIKKKLDVIHSDVVIVKQQTRKEP